MLQQYDWPVNVRQLEYTVFRAVVLCEGHVLQPQDFPQISGVMPDLSSLPEAPVVPVAANAVPTAPLAANDFAGQAADGPVVVFGDDGEMRPMEEIERDLLQLAIDHYDGHMSEVSRRLGIGRSTLYRKVREFDLAVRGEREAS